MKPLAYAWLADEPAPKILLEALKDHGLTEVPGPANSSRILEMARLVGAASYYKADSTPWCALALAAWVKAAGYELPADPLRALSWQKWGTKADKPMLGDVLVFVRNGGGHVGLCVGEDPACYHVLGANQGDAVCIVRIAKQRLVAARRSPFKLRQPANVRVVKLLPVGSASTNEA